MSNHFPPILWFQKPDFHESLKVRIGMEEAGSQP